MKLFVILLLTTACTTSSQQVPGPVKFLEQDAKIRRHAVSYSTNVIHQNPKYPDQHAESSINVDFNPQKTNQQLSRPIIQNQPNTLYQSYSNLHHHQQQQQQQQQQYLRRPKSQQAYANSNNIQTLQRHPQYSSEDKQQQNRQIFKPNYNSPQSQSFNVGYSVSFTGGQKHQLPRAFSAQKLENAEIITGSRKEPVRKPTNNNFEGNDFVNNALIDFKKQKISGIKPKLTKFPNHKENDAKDFINNLAPKTQQYLSYLGDAKPIGTSNIRFRQQLQSNDVQAIQNTQNLKNAWTNLSPSVEIYHSKELPQAHSFTVKEQLEQSKHFDHAGALGKSQGFDYSNAVDSAGDKNQLPSVQPHQEVTENVVTTEDIKNQPSLVPTYYDFTQNVQPAPLVVPFTNHFDTINVLPIGEFQISSKSGGGQDVTKQIPAQTSSPVTVLHEPILSLNGKNLPNDPHTITIPFDTALLQAMQHKLLTSAQPVESFDAGKGQVQTLQGNVGITEQQQQQQYQGQVENLQVQPLQGINQDNFQDQGFKQFQGQQYQQPTQQFTVYGSPHALFLKKDFDKYFDQQFDKMQTQESRYDSVSLRPPKVNNSNNKNIRVRSLKGQEILMNLQPPPIIKITRHRRMFI